MKYKASEELYSFFKVLVKPEYKEEVLNNKGITTDPIMELETNEMTLNYIKVLKNLRTSIYKTI